MWKLGLKMGLRPFYGCLNDSQWANLMIIHSNWGSRGVPDFPRFSDKHKSHIPEWQQYLTFSTNQSASMISAVSWRQMKQFLASWQLNRTTFGRVARIKELTGSNFRECDGRNFPKLEAWWLFWAPVIALSRGICSTRHLQSWNWTCPEKSTARWSSGDIWKWQTLPLGHPT